jgi:putative mycofactocin binding protein MftB
LDAGRGYELHPQVAVRPESFGGLAYHYGNRRLTFLKAKPLVGLVERLGDYASLEEALADRVPPTQHAAYLQALEGLLASEVIRVR